MKRVTIITVILILLLLLVHAQFVDAQRFVQQDVFAATLIPGSEPDKTTIPVNDVQVLGYVCTAPGCSQVGDVIFQTTTGNDNNVVLTYPTQLQNPYGYGIFFYKPGYVTWELRADWYGTYPGDPAGPFDAYVAKAQGCRAPVDTFSVVDAQNPNQPIVIDVETSLSATTRSALSNNGPIDHIPAALLSYYQVATRLDLQIEDEQGNVVHTASKNMNIDFDGSERTSFTFTPTQPGRYTATVTSEVTDDKCSSQFNEYSEKEFSVFTDAPSNTCVALLNDLNGLPVKQKVDQPVTITLKSQADSYDIFGQPKGEASNLNVIITYEGSTVYQDQIYVPASQDPQTAQTVELEWTPQDAGEHRITVTSDIYCPYSDEKNDEVAQSYFVAGSEPPVLSPIADQYLLKNSGINQDLENLGNKVFDLDSNNLLLSIASQSNTDVVECSIDANDYLDCTVKPNKIGESQVTVQVTDGTSFDEQSFTVFVTAGDAPTLNIPDQNLDANSGFNSEVVDLFAYADDDQDTDSQLDFTLLSESNTAIVDCTLRQDRFVDCSVQPNVVGRSDVTIRVTDTLGNSVQDTFGVIVDGDVVLPQCSDGIDNDNDGKVDLYDPGCSGPNDDDESDDPTLPQCSDGIDNDNDGKVDLYDPGCSGPNDDDESDDPMLPQCSDGIDNDFDGRTDFPEDKGCFSPTDDSEQGRLTCSDSDGGFVTATKGTVTLAEEGYIFEQQTDYCADDWILVEFVCSVGDAEPRQIDCAYGCSNGKCNSEPQPMPECKDGVDNDNDGLIDFPNDPGCSSPSDDDEYNVPPQKNQCEDGIDNDNDGLIDFPNDPGCSSPSDDDEYNFIPTPKQCADGIDNDNDGKVDLDDPGCSSADDDDESDDPQLPKAQLQVIHSAADPGLFLVDVYVNDVRLLNDFVFQTATPFISVDARTSLDVDIVSASANNNNQPLFSTTINLEENTKNVVIATGVGDDRGFISNPNGRDIEFTLILEEDVQDGGTAFNNVDILLAQTATDLQRFDMLTRSQKTIAENVVYEQTKDDISLFATQYIIDLVDDQNETLIRSFNANAFNTLGGEFITLFTSGFYNTSLNQNGPALSLLGVKSDGTIIVFPVIAQCSDGIDNDHDGLTDMDDPGCSSPSDDNEYDYTPACSNGIDDDGDGKVDLADPGCSGPNDEDESDDPKLNQCEDGIDNDFDGRIDFPEDKGCSSPNDDSESGTLTCTDSDGGFATLLKGTVSLAEQGSIFEQQTDYCLDDSTLVEFVCSANDAEPISTTCPFGCSSGKCNSEPDPTPQCADGIDNDNDGLVDLADPGCSSADDDDEYNAPNNDVDATLFLDPTSGVGTYSGLATCTVSGQDTPLSVTLNVDGVTVVDQVTQASSYTINYPIEFTQAGSYQVFCTVQDSNGDLDVDAQVITVDLAPVFVSECEDGIDNDGDGEIDGDDPACERGMHHESDDPAEDEGLFVAGIDVIDVRSDYIDLHVGVRNLGSRDVDNVKITAMIPEYNAYTSIGPFDIDGGDRENKRMLLPLYADLPKGEHLLRISISSEGDHRIKHRWIWVE